MKTYIQQLASDLLQRFGHDLSRVAVVFPNKRASLFLNQELARQAGTAIWSPSYITISELFRRHSDLEVADQILLVCRLYDVYCRITGYEGETLDRFYNWGLILLADFDDIDKNMANADKLFQLVTDIHQLDTANYLSDEQREVLKHFFKSFIDDKDSQMKEKFLRLWSKLSSIYSTFRNELRDDKLAYEGMMYRDVVEMEDIEFEYDTYCFVGFNMLQKVEQQLFMKLKNKGKALFYWDYDSYYLNKHHEAGHFIGEYLGRFPQASDNITGGYDSFYEKSSHGSHTLTIASASTENLQARYVRDWLLENDRWKAGARTAIVMSDERLLQTIIRSLPKEIEKVNITTGYPLAQSPAMSLLHNLIELQTAGHISGTDKYRLRQVNKILRHPFARYVSEDVTTLYKSLNKDKNYYPSRTALAIPLLFDDIDSITLTGYDILPQNAKICVWLQQIVRCISQSPLLQKDALTSESLFRTYQILQRLFSLTIDGTLSVDITTFRHLLTQIINSTTVPYHGEPIEGIQIMGVLETRCLDFDHVLLLSGNEGNMPKGVNDSSFIPHSIRRAYELTTVENKVGIYSYYFHRLLQRSSDVTITYNSSTEGMNTGEMSRFMLQLMVESNVNIRRISLQTGQDSKTSIPQAIKKDEETMQRLYRNFFGEKRSVSPSSLSKYLRCPVRYYYEYVAGLKEQDDDDIDEMDNVTFGLIFHSAAEKIYLDLMSPSDHKVHADSIKRALADESYIPRFVNEAFADELFHIPEGNAELRRSIANNYTGLQLINRRVIIRLIQDLLRFDIKSAPIKILGCEKKAYAPINVQTADGIRSVTIGGTIDRLDMIGNDNQGYQIRVIDYKTGSNEQGKMNDINAIFDPSSIANHSDYYLQAMLYSIIVRSSREVNPDNMPVSPALLFIQKTRREGYTPILSVGGQLINDIKDMQDEFVTQLSDLLSTIINPDVPFTPTSDSRRCESCPFRMMCGI